MYVVCARKEVDMSTFSIDQMNQLGDSFEANGWDASLVAKLGQCGRLPDIQAFLEGRAKIVMKKGEEAFVPFLNLIKTVAVTKVAGKKTADCFNSKALYAYRDPDLDRWLLASQRDEAAGTFSVQELGQQKTFMGMLQGLGITGDVSAVAQEIKKRGFVTTLSRVESLVEQQEGGGDVGLRTEGYANFFFVEDKDGGVSVVHAYRDGRQWDVYIYGLDYGLVWNVGRRFFFRN